MRNEPSNLQPSETKRKPNQRATRHDARRFIHNVQRNIRESFRNTSNCELVADYFDATPRSVSDVVLAGHDATVQDHGNRLAAIEQRLGMGRAQTATGRLTLVRKMA